MKDEKTNPIIEEEALNAVEGTPEGKACLADEELLTVSGGAKRPPDGKYRCPYCPAAFNDVASYIDHIAMIHGQ